MNKHHKITASERDHIVWWLAFGITIREMARRLGRRPYKVLNYQPSSEVFTAHIMQGVRIETT